MHNVNQKGIHRLTSRTRSAAVLFTLVLTFSSVLHSQAAHSGIRTIRADQFPVPNSEVRLLLQGVKADADYVIGIQINDTFHHTGAIEVGDFVATGTPPSVRVFQSFNEIGKDKVQVGPDSVTITGLSEFQGNVYALLTVPTATRVTIMVNDRSEFTGTPTKGMILHRGRVLSEELLGRHQLYAKLLLPEVDDPQPELTKTTTGFMISPEGLSKHLLNFNKPANHPESVFGDPTVVALEVKIDPTGKVTDVKSLRGQDPFVADSIRALSEARFRPFVVDGSSVQAAGYVTIAFFKDGRVASTLH